MSEAAYSAERKALPTAGERLVGRVLAKETRAGIEHYKPGQHEAIIYHGCVEYGTDLPCEIGRVTFVDVMGHACVVLTFRYLGQGEQEWRATWVSRAGQHFEEKARQVDDFPLSEKMLAALNAAPVENV